MMEWKDVISPEVQKTMEKFERIPVGPDGVHQILEHLRSLSENDRMEFLFLQILFKNEQTRSQTNEGPK